MAKQQRMQILTVFMSLYFYSLVQAGTSGYPRTHPTYLLPVSFRSLRLRGVRKPRGALEKKAMGGTVLVGCECGKILQ